MSQSGAVRLGMSNGLAYARLLAESLDKAAAWIKQPIKTLNSTEAYPAWEQRLGKR